MSWQTFVTGWTRGSRLRGHSRTLAQPTIYAPEVAQPLDEQLASSLAARFTERVMDAAALPFARAPEVRESCETSRDGPLLRLTCTITGSSYDRPWDGSERRGRRARGRGSRRHGLAHHEDTALRLDALATLTLLR